MAKDVIREFAADGVKYLELRSTPREEKNTGKHVNTETNHFDGMVYHQDCFIKLLALHMCYLSPVGLTKKTYVETVIKAIQQCKGEGVDIDVR